MSSTYSVPVCAPGARRPRQPDVLRLDGDAALALDVHPVEVLGAHVAALDDAGDLEHPVGQRRLAVVDVGDDAEVPDAGRIGGCRSRHSAAIVPRRRAASSDRPPERPRGRSSRTRVGVAGRRWYLGRPVRRRGFCSAPGRTVRHLPSETPRLTRGEHQVPDQADPDQREGASAQRRGQVRPEDGGPARPHRRRGRGRRGRGHRSARSPARRWTRPPARASSTRTRPPTASRGWPSRSPSL